MALSGLHRAGPRLERTFHTSDRCPSYHRRSVKSRRDGYQTHTTLGKVYRHAGSEARACESISTIRRSNCAEIAEPALIFEVGLLKFTSSCSEALRLFHHSPNSSVYSTSHST